MTSMAAIQQGASSERATPTRRRFSTAVDRTMETWEGLLYRLPVVVMRRTSLDQRMRTAFDYGREVELEVAIAAKRNRATAPTPVRHLRVVGS